MKTAAINDRNSGIASLRSLVSPRAWKGVLGLLGILALWQTSIPLIGVSEYFYPSPAAVARAAIHLVKTGILPAYIGDSLGRYLAGVSIGVTLGILFGLLIGFSAGASRMLSPIINFFFAIVEVAWIPLFVLWWGYGLKVILVALSYIVFFPVLYNTILGVRSVPQVLINAAYSLGATRLQLIQEVILPAALPSIFTGLRLGAGFAFRGLIFSEMIAAKSGVGYLIFEGASNQQTDRTIVGMIVMGLLWLFIERIYIRPLEALTVDRWGLATRAEDRE
ncbi:MAG: ABC transporter permease [Proteobacteria bacterium]|nr:ABC transporter permease [Pseudomonadota bacterium]